MNLQGELSTVFSGLTLLLLSGGAKFLISYAKDLSRRVDETRDGVAALNGRLGKIETRVSDSEITSTVQHEAIDRREEDCRSNLRRELDAVWRRIGDRPGEEFHSNRR